MLGLVISKHACDSLHLCKFVDGTHILLMSHVQALVVIFDLSFFLALLPQISTLCGLFKHRTPDGEKYRNSYP